MVRLLAEKGGRDAFVSLPGDLSVIENLLIVPVSDSGNPATRQVHLPEPWSKTTRLIDVLQGGTIEATSPGVFAEVPPGAYRME